MLSGKKVLITAGASRTGRACAELFARHGAVIAIADINRETGRAAVSQMQDIAPGSRYYHVDLTCVDSIKALCNQYLADFGPPDVWLNCAGVFHPAYIDEQEDAPLAEMISLNLLSAFRIMSCLADPMKQSQGGSIIHIVSDYAVTGANGSSAYSATKGGLYSLVNSFAVDYAPFGIRVNSILPGVSLASSGDRIEQEVGSEEAAAYWEYTQLLPRRGRLDEMADAALFLASDMSRLVSGEGIYVNGGQNVIAHSQAYWRRWRD